jgi:glutamate/tyrosine decarboxylase-like PLP-dependent enzyme
MEISQTFNPNEQTLDPQDWGEMRRLAHQMTDDMMDLLQHIRERPSWTKMPDEPKQFLHQDVPQKPQDIADVYADFKQYVLPYVKGNIHPRFWAWVQGTGTPLGVMADMLASAMNPNVAMGEHSATYVDKQVVDWCKQIMGYPPTASGVLVSGATMANLTALLVARNYKAANSRKQGISSAPGNMVMYCSAETHSCITKAAEAMGIGTDGARKIAVNKGYQIDIDALRKRIDEDIAAGFFPFCVVGNAGTVNTGAIDDLHALKNVCADYNLWFHVDGAFGALAKLTNTYSEQLAAIEDADSVAIDLHKWMYMPYEVGCALVKNAEAHRNTFFTAPNYLLTHERGIAAGPDPIQHYGIELSRGFKALKVWMSIKEHGLEKYTALIQQNINQAFYTGELVKQHTNLELLTPVTLNIVCYRFVEPGLSDAALNDVNKEILMRLQEEGIATPSSTVLQGRYAIRVAITNHRSKREDFDVLVKETIRIGKQVLAEMAAKV